MSNEEQKNPESAENMFDVGIDESVDETTNGLSEIEPLEPVAALEEQVGQLKDQLLRVHAEMENVRRRAAEDVSKAHKFSIERFANELLPVQESLEKALSDSTGDIATLREGVELTQKQLTNALEKGGVLVIDPKGEKFDPHFHQAISMVPAPDQAPNTVIEVLQKGYKIADRVLRPALVIVAQG